MTKEADTTLAAALLANAARDALLGFPPTARIEARRASGLLGIKLRSRKEPKRPLSDEHCKAAAFNLLHAATDVLNDIDPTRRIKWAWSLLHGRKPW